MKLKPAPQIPKETILGWEKELLGVYLTDHPFKAYESRTKGKVKSIKEILEIPKAGEKSAPMLIAGIVMSVQKIITKKGKPMAFVKIEDATQNIELLVFTETLKKTETVWNEGSAIIAKGFLTWKNDETKFIIDDARAIAM
jgi:DNA polymerase-3 subunit alpha